MRQTAHDPGSIDVGSCSRAVMTDECWRTECSVRGRNAFGALVLNRVTFWFRWVDDRYASVVDIDD